MLDPRDFALVNDGLDGRLDAVAMAALRARIAAEPELLAAWDDLTKIRGTLRSMAAPAVPAGFLEGVRARASSEESASAPQGRILGFPRSWFYAAAAVLGIGLGLGLYVASQRDAFSSRTDTQAARAPEGEGYLVDPLAKNETRTTVSRTDAARPTAEEAKSLDDVRANGSFDKSTPSEAPAAGAAPSGGAGRGGGAGGAPSRPQVFGPGGAVPPNLREPRDAPPPPAPPSAPAAATAVSPAPIVPVAPPEATPPLPTPAPRSKEPQGTAVGKTGPSSPGPAKGAKEADEGNDATDVDRPLRIAALDFDQARADLALLVARIRRGDAIDTQAEWRKRRAGAEGLVAGARQADDAKAPGAPEAPSEAGAGKAKDAEKHVPPAEAVILGAFVFDLTPEHATRLAAILGGGAPPSASKKSAASVPVRVVVVKQ